MRSKKSPLIQWAFENGSHGGSIAVTETNGTSLVPDALLHFVPADGFIVDLFHADTDIARIYHSRIIGHPTIVQVTMYVGAKPVQRRGMQGHVAQDHAIDHVIGPDVPEVSRVVLELEDVVIALDQDLVAVEPAQRGQALAIDHHIA